MWTTLAFVTTLVLAPAQTGELRLTNARATYGVLGAPRKDNRVLPGDFYFITFDIENLLVDSEGKIHYSMGMELINPDNEIEYKKTPQERPITQYNVLGGTKIPAFAHAQTGVETKPGIYTLKVTVIDRLSKQQASLERKFEVIKPAFGLVELSTSYDKDGIFSAPPMGVTGQSLFVNFWAVGFARNAKGQPHIQLEMTIKDATGKMTHPKPITGEFTEIPKGWKRLPMQFPLSLNRTGRFTVTIKATDLIGGKKVDQISFPITVVELK
ncbi:MAG: hypothetical protein KatS3mg105_1315 [Gemmatales bacterium]|nr:MAG: hypothetical protein KatS3mg105_1315 [Gemmatales bacterium]